MVTREEKEVQEFLVKVLTIPKEEEEPKEVAWKKEEEVAVEASSKVKGAAITQTEAHVAIAVVVNTVAEVVACEAQTKKAQ